VSARRDAAAGDDGGAVDARIAAAADALAAIQADIEVARAQLRSVNRELEEARALMRGNHAARLLEANEQLVQAALRARDAADTARGDLDELAEVSGRDALTGLPTRARFLDRLGAAVATARRGNQCLSVLFIDLDDFKHINDTQGHAAGDSVLQWVGAKLSESVRESDAASRFGGDEFVLLLTNVSGRAAVTLVAAKIRSSLAMAGCVDPAGKVVEPTAISASIGIAMFPEDGTEPAQLIAAADTAMYDAKRLAHGRSGLRDPFDDGSAPA
jgi:diguanylate cyclase (GGDEF)-like protein